MKMFNSPSNSWNVNHNDPINSFSHDQYYSHNFQKPCQQEYQYNYTFNSKQGVSHHLDHPQYHSCADQPLSFPDAYTSPFEDQNLLPQNCHGINVSQHFYYSQPSFVKESADKTSDVLLPSETNFTPTVTSSKLVKSDSDRSGEDLSKSVAPADQNDQPQIPRKRSGGGGCGDSGNNKSKKRKDRHSKIDTGTTRPRHRRMRLSIDVAREFFDLQELLGFERASKTVEWLLRKARSDIKKLKDSNNEAGCSSTCPEMQTPSLNSESCEGASGLDEVGINGEDQGVAGTSSSKSLVKERKKYGRSKSKRIAINPLAKEMREKARERARERTREKMRKRVETVEPEAQNHRGRSGGGGGGSRTKIANHNKDHDDHSLKINQPVSNKSEEKQQTGAQLLNQNIMTIDMDNNIDTPNSSLGVVMQVSRYDQRYEFSQEILPISNPNGWNIVQVSNHDHILQTSTSSTCTTSAPIVDYETYSYLVNHLEKWNNSLVANSVGNFGTTSGATGFGVPQQHQFNLSNFQVFGNALEGFNNSPNLC